MKKEIERGSLPDIGELAANKGPIDLMSKNFKIYVGISEGRYFITSRQASLSIGDEVRVPLTFLFFYSHPLTLNYLRILKSLEFTLPSRVSECSSHANRMACFTYRGSVECIFNYSARCPLRALLRNSAGIQKGALPMLDDALELIEKQGSYNVNSNERALDYQLTRLFLEILYAIAWKTAMETSKIMKIIIELEDPPLRIDNPLKENLSAKANRAINFLLESLRSIMEIDDSYQARTRLILYLESFPKFVGLIGGYVSSMEAYSFCRKAKLEEGVIRGLIEYYYPFLKGKLSESLAREIAWLLSEDGCIEPEEIAHHVSEELAYKILDTLAQKYILKKVTRKGRSVFVAGP